MNGIVNDVIHVARKSPFNGMYAGRPKPTPLPPRCAKVGHTGPDGYTEDSPFAWLTAHEIKVVEPAYYGCVAALNDSFDPVEMALNYLVYRYERETAPFRITSCLKQWTIRPETRDRLRQNLTESFAAIVRERPGKLKDAVSEILAATYGPTRREEILAHNFFTRVGIGNDRKGEHVYPDYAAKRISAFLFQANPDAKQDPGKVEKTKRALASLARGLCSIGCVLGAVGAASAASAASADSAGTADKKTR
jgi:hypothetical protein